MAVINLRRLIQNELRDQVHAADGNLKQIAAELRSRVCEPPVGRLCRPRSEAEPKALRYRLLRVAARLTHGQRRLWLRIQRAWPWATELATAFTRLAALPVPTG